MKPSATNLVPHFKALEVEEQTLSYGKNASTMSLIDEHEKALEVAFFIENRDDTDKVILLAPIYSRGTIASNITDVNNTQFATEALALAETSSTTIFKAGTTGAVGKELVIGEVDAKRTIDQLIRYASQTPIRLTRISMTSTKIATSEKDKTNYSGVIKSFFPSPFDVTTERVLPMRTLQAGNNNFNPDMLEVDFIKQNFPAIISNENFMQLTVKAGTRLDFSLFVGAQNSAAQQLYRKIKKADEIMRPLRLGYGG